MCFLWLVLQNKQPYPTDVYRPSTCLEQSETAPAEITKSALKNGSAINHKQVKRSVRIKEAGFKHETLVERKIRVASLAKPANVRVKIKQSYEPIDREELKVRKGQHVKILYQQNDWLYVVDSSGSEGFIPYHYCSTNSVSTDSKSSTSGYEDSFEESEDGPTCVERTSTTEPQFAKDKHDTNAVSYFPKRAYGPQLIVLYDYRAQEENDVSVCRGELVMLLNDQDKDWLWISTEDGEEGFVPRTFLVSHVCEGKYGSLLYLAYCNCVIHAVANDKPPRIWTFEGRASNGCSCYSGVRIYVVPNVSRPGCLTKNSKLHFTCARGMQVLFFSLKTVEIWGWVHRLEL